jgi:hypothetical protein
VLALRMGAVVVVFVLLTVVCTWVGVKLIKRGVQPSKDKPESLGLGSVFALPLGVGLIAAPWLLVWSLFRGLGSMGDHAFTKGRVLRIRNRARLPEPATGDGWGGTVVVLDTTLTDLERSVARTGIVWRARRPNGCRSPNGDSLVGSSERG